MIFFRKTFGVAIVAVCCLLLVGDVVARVAENADILPGLEEAHDRETADTGEEGFIRNKAREEGIDDGAADGAEGPDDSEDPDVQTVGAKDPTLAFVKKEFEQDILLSKYDFNPLEGIHLPSLTYPDLFHTMDKDTDGRVTAKELHEWLSYLMAAQEAHGAAEEWEGIEKQDHRYITEDEYATAFHLGRQNVQYLPEEERDEAIRDIDQNQALMTRRWNHADIDKDGKLSFVEFIHFLHPHGKKHLHEHYIEERWAEVDHDKDGVVSVNEYLGAVYNDDTDLGDYLKTAKLDLSRFGEDRVLFQNGTRVPVDVRLLIREFAVNYDKDGDWKLTLNEARPWLQSQDMSTAQGELIHILREVDDDQDRSISLEEFMASKKAFMESEITSYGQIIVQPTHEEL